MTFFQDWSKFSISFTKGIPFLLYPKNEPACPVTQCGVTIYITKILLFR